MDEIRVGYFLEDICHEEFVVSLTERIAGEVDLPGDILEHDRRSVSGGAGTAMTELRQFLLDVKREREVAFDVLVIAIDGNCHGYQEKRGEIQEIVQGTNYPGAVVCAVPDPHIERWYLLDPDALSEALGANVTPQAPPYKCERGRYKQALRQAIRETGIVAPLGGAEYGREVARALSVYAVGKIDGGFRHFEDTLRKTLKDLRRITE